MIHICIDMQYPSPYLFFTTMGFHFSWVRFNLKNPSKSGFFDQKWGSIYEQKPKKLLLKRDGVVFKSGAVYKQ